MRFNDEEYIRHPFYGSREMRDYLGRQGYAVNRKRIQRLMRLTGMASVAPKPNTRVPGTAHKIYPYLLRQLDIDRPNQVWCREFTFIRVAKDFVYVTAVMEWHSRAVLSWQVSVTMEDRFCVSALEIALRRFSTPEIFNTDQGAQYTGQAFIGTLKDPGIRISMDGKARAKDNIQIERLWRSAKYEEVYLKEYQSVIHLLYNPNQDITRELAEFSNLVEKNTDIRMSINEGVLDNA